MFVVTALGNGIERQCIMESKMRKQILTILAVVVTAMTIFSCNDARKSETYRLLEDVDSYIEARPDSALAVLENIDNDELNTREEKAKYALLTSMALDKNYIDRTDFEVLQPAIDYYEDHGSATDKLRTFYYQGRIYQNGGDDEMAMECFVRAVEEGENSQDHLTKARTLYAQGLIYSSLYDWERLIDVSIKAESLYKVCKKYSLQLNCISRITNAYTMLGEKDKAFEYLTLSKEIFSTANYQSKSILLATYLSYLAIFEEHNEQVICNAIKEYISIIPKEYIDWLAVANTYMTIGFKGEAVESLSKYEIAEDKKQNVKYYALLSELYDKKGLHYESLLAYKKYVTLSDEIDMAVYLQDTKFIEERHQLELKALQEKEAKIRTALICIIALLIALIAIYLIRKQLQIRTAEKKQLEIEKKRYEQLYADAIAERDALTKMIEDSSVKDETKAVIRERLEVLNKVIISHITDTSSANKKAFQELEALVADRDSFIESTRLTIEGNNPEFIAALKKQGLTDEEINICCLYVIGLKGKDIKAYTSQPRHYNQSADIRHKLGLTENDTNLSIYLRELHEK